MREFRWLMVMGWVAALGAGTLAGADEAKLVEVRKIWDAGQHNAFTDLIRWHDQWWCTFRESEGHVGGDGKIRVINSSDGEKWSSSALIEEKGIDLRDPKLSITPDDRLMIVAGGSIYEGTKVLKGRQPRVMFSRDGREWTQPATVLRPGEWLWRVTWHDGTAYGIAYNTNGRPGGPVDAKGKPDNALTLYSSKDGLKWDDGTPLAPTGKPNETTLRFLKNGQAVALVRREAQDCHGWIGTATAPYREWSWTPTDFILGGPNFIELENGSLIATTRDYRKSPKNTTVVAKMTTRSIEPILTLPSGGDNSYAGMVMHNGLLWISYYSSHEGRTSIYLAKVKL